MTDAPVIVVAAITRRVVDVWMPMLEALQARGARIETLLFPREADPDHRGLDDLPFEVRLSAPPPIDDTSLPILDDLPALAALNARLRRSFTERPADAILCCTANITPENQLRTALADLPDRPLIVGLQHGFVQWWPSYTRRFDYDLFGVMGPAFRAHFPPEQRERVLALGMTELAGLTPDEASGDHLLFAAQQEPGPEVVGPLLRALSEHLGLRPLVRRHPEHRQAFAALETDFAFSEAGTIEEDLKRSPVMISTGSTSVLKALAMGRRVIVLPQQGGDLFAPLGVVADDPTLDSALRVLERQAEPGFADARDRFLDAHCGSRDRNAPDLAAATLLEALASRRKSGANPLPRG